MVVHYPRTVWKNCYAEHNVTGETYKKTHKETQLLSEYMAIPTPTYNAMAMYNDRSFAVIYSDDRSRLSEGHKEYSLHD